MEKITPGKNSPGEQGDFFSGGSLDRYTNPDSPEFYSRLIDVAVSRYDLANKNNSLRRAPLYVVQDLLAELKLEGRFGVAPVVTSLMDALRNREDTAKRAEMSVLAAKKLRPEMSDPVVKEENPSDDDGRWPEDGKPDEKIPYWIKY